MEIPEDIFDDDVSCCEFWCGKIKYLHLHYGAGDSIDEAVDNLKKTNIVEVMIMKINKE